MKEDVEVIVAITFVPDDINYAIVDAFTYPDGKAYQRGLDGINELTENHGGGFKGLADYLQKHIIESSEPLRRYPNCDYDDNPIAPIKKMFEKGFDKVQKADFVWAGMGHTTLFLGRLHALLDGETLELTREVDYGDEQ